MKKSMFMCFLVFILFQSCNREEVIIIEEEILPTCELCEFTCLDKNETEVITSNCIDNWMCDFKIWPESIVDTSEYRGYASGNKQVFKMVNYTEGDSVIIDDEKSEHLIFELEESQSSFSVEDNELASLKVHYYYFWFGGHLFKYRAVESGCLQGEKQEDGTWRVQGFLNPPAPFDFRVLKIDTRFEE